MAFSDDMKNLVNMGISASKDFIDKAQKGAKELGEKGIGKVESMQLRAKAERLMTKLGTQVWIALEEQGRPSVGSDDEQISSVLAEIRRVKDEIEEVEGQGK